MRVREFRKNVRRSLATTVRVKNRAQLVRYISAKLSKKGAPIPDDLIHVTHYGYDDRIGWDEHIIVVEGFGVFGYTDGPCPTLAQVAAQADEEEFSEIESAFAPAQQPKLQRLREAPRAALRRLHAPAAREATALKA